MNAYELVYIGYQTSFSATSLKLDGLSERQLMIIVCFFTCSMEPDTVVTFTRGHFKQVVFAVN